MKELYVGSTNDLKRRFKEHNNGEVFSTKNKKPWNLVYYEAFFSEKDARNREKKLKQHKQGLSHLKTRIQNSIKESGGFTLIELVISIFILAFAIIGVYNSFSTIVILTTGSTSRFTAVYLAQEGIEIVRNMRDSNWLNGQDWKTGFSGCESGCEADYKTGTSSGLGLIPWTSDGNYLNIKGNNFYSYDNCGGDNFCPTKFKRKITITPDPLNQNVLKVSALVIWEEKEEVPDMEVEEYLYNWY
ncbi:MAG: GIY-YIG nuclease family protein [Candidatus Staskawiczbacteria bacterium]|nr:GIY-YIG nuclease family protein [Candidatus Staskawiczbacteria bacterium]MBI3337165.1 GIY-YIG nuclease family protein [Candidatus Staskawiczbacteria bacterium]